jgi:UDP-glucose 4-epimerase
MNNTYLIIGGAGFIGSHLADVCCQNGKNVIIFDNFNKGKKEYLRHLANIEIVKDDILDLVALTSCINKFQPEFVFHLAAIHFIPDCENNPSRALRINVEGTQNVLQATTGKKNTLIFTSTGAIYDPSLTSALNENSAIKTGDVYGITKLTAEELIRYHVSKGRGKVVIARLFNAVGTRETNPHLIPAIMEQLSNGNWKVELGNLSPKRDYVHVLDIAEGLFSISQTKMSEDLEIFNVGSGIEFSVEELVAQCGEAAGKPIIIESVGSRRRKYDRPSQLADIQKMAEICKWFPKRSLKEALEDVWKNEILSN